MIFLLNKQDRVVIHPEALKLTVHLKKCDFDQLRYIVLAYDYWSKYRLFTLQERKQYAYQEVYGKGTKEDPEQNTILKLAIEEYNTLQYDPIRETRRVIVDKIDSILKQITEIQDEKELINKDKILTVFEKRLKEIDDKIYKLDQEEIVNYKKPPSFIEKWQTNLRNKIKAEEQKNMNEGMNELLTSSEIVMPLEKSTDSEPDLSDFD